MSLWSGVDTIAVVSHGVYSETYGVGEEANVASLFASFGLLEDASRAAPSRSKWLLYYFKKFIKR